MLDSIPSLPAIRIDHPSPAISTTSEPSVKTLRVGTNHGRWRRNQRRSTAASGARRACIIVHGRNVRKTAARLAARSSAKSTARNEFEMVVAVAVARRQACGSVGTDAVKPSQNKTRANYVPGEGGTRRTWLPSAAAYSSPRFFVSHFSRAWTAAAVAATATQVLLACGCSYNRARYTCPWPPPRGARRPAARPHPAHCSAERFIKSLPGLQHAPASRRIPLLLFRLFPPFLLGLLYSIRISLEVTVSW